MLRVSSENIDNNQNIHAFVQQPSEGNLEGRKVIPADAADYELVIFDDYNPKALQEPDDHLDLSEWVIIDTPVSLQEIDGEKVAFLQNRSKELEVDLQSLTPDLEIKSVMGEAFLSYLYTGSQAKLDAMYARLLGEDPSLASKARLFMHENGRDIEAVRSAYQQFDQDLADARQIAASIHSELLQAARGAELPHTDPITGITTAPESLIKFAFERAWVAFSPLYQMANTPEHDIQIARLVQVILCGEDALAKVAMPSSPFCFSASELAGKESPQIAVQVQAGTSPLEHFLQASKTKGDASFNECIKEVIELFFKDVVTRSGMGFKCGDTELTCDSPNMEEEAFITRRLSTLYGDHLRANPEIVDELIRQHKASPLLTKAQEAYGKQGELFSMDTLKAMLLTAQPQEVVERFVASAGFSPALLEGIARRSGCDKDEVANLMAAKLLEVMILMNQAFLFQPWAPLAVGLMEQNPSLSATPTARVFDYANPALASLCNRNSYTVQMNEPGYNEEGLPPQIKASLEMARVLTKLNIPDVHALQDQNVAITPMEDVHFSWRATPSVVDAVHRMVLPLPGVDARMISLQEAGWMWKTAASIGNLVWYLNPFALVGYR